jgi:hypothetical protein
MDKHHEIHIRWTDVEDKHTWMIALARLLDRIEKRGGLSADEERQALKLVKDRLEVEFIEEKIGWPLPWPESKSTPASQS